MGNSVVMGETAESNPAEGDTSHLTLSPVMEYGQHCSVQTISGEAPCLSKE